MVLVNKPEGMKSAARLDELVFMSIKTSVMTGGKIELFSTDINR